MNESRLRSILISAYACEPDKGSEPEVGLQTVLAASRRYPVHVMTRSNNVEALESYLESCDTRNPIHVVGVDLSARPWSLKHRGPLGFYWYYDRWQALATETAQSLHDRVGFDLIHHVTLATYWQRAITPAFDVPTVLGPVGGGATTPFALLPVLGASGIVRDTVRWVTQRLWERRPSVARTLRTADVVLAQNPETAQRIANDTVVIVTNGTSASIQVEIPSTRENEVLVVGRLIPFKAGALAIESFALLDHPDMRLVFIGDGPERARLERIAKQTHVGDRIDFAGRLPRADTLRRMSGARALLHPALHDDSPLTVAESLSLGTPVVCLDLGGPPVLCSLWPEDLSEVIPLSDREGTAGALAEALGRVIGRAEIDRSTPIPPRRSFESELMRAYDLALGSSPQR